MDNSNNAARLLTVSLRLYRALLAVYPAEFRLAYGGPMQQVFRDCCRRALHENGGAGLLALWGRTILDTVKTALEEHIQRGVDMSKEKFIKLSGWSLMLAGLTLVLGFLAGTRPEYNRFNARSLPIDQYANAAAGPLMAITMFLLVVGFIGLFLKYGRRAGSFGQASLGLGALGAVAAAIGTVGLGITDVEPWWSIFFAGFIFAFLGLALFGLVNLRQRVLPRWNALPVMAGIWVPIYILIILTLEQSRGSWVQTPMTVDMFVFVLTAAGLIGLGYMLQFELQQAEPAMVAV